MRFPRDILSPRGTAFASELARTTASIIQDKAVMPKHTFAQARKHFFAATPRDKNGAVC